MCLCVMVVSQPIILSPGFCRHGKKGSLLDVRKSLKILRPCPGLLFPLLFFNTTEYELKPHLASRKPPSWLFLLTIQLPTLLVRQLNFKKSFQVEIWLLQYISRSKYSIFHLFSENCIGNKLILRAISTQVGILHKKTSLSMFTTNPAKLLLCLKVS